MESEVNPFASDLSKSNNEELERPTELPPEDAISVEGAELVLPDMEPPSSGEVLASPRNETEPPIILTEGFVAPNMSPDEALGGVSVAEEEIVVPDQDPPP